MSQEAMGAAKEKLSSEHFAQIFGWDPNEEPPIDFEGEENHAAQGVDEGILDNSDSSTA